VDIYPPSLQADDTAHLGDVQPVRPADPITPDDAAEPIVYITLGTVFNDDLALFILAVEGARELGIRVVVTLGPGNDPAALGPQPSHVTVEQFIPQAELLPACAAVVSHAGSGTFLAALAAGVPQVLLPQAADQFLNAQAGAEGGVAVVVPRAEASAARVREALERVLGEGGFRQAAESVRSEISAMPAPEAVAAELERRYAP
jgi:MGT family glycosyltransferase